MVELIGEIIHALAVYILDKYREGQLGSLKTSLLAGIIFFIPFFIFSMYSLIFEKNFAMINFVGILFMSACLISLFTYLIIKITSYIKDK